MSSENGLIGLLTGPNADISLTELQRTIWQQETLE